MKPRRPPLRLRQSPPFKTTRVIANLRRLLRSKSNEKQKTRRVPGFLFSRGCHVASDTIPPSRLARSTDCCSAISGPGHSWRSPPALTTAFAEIPNSLGYSGIRAHDVFVAALPLAIIGDESAHAPACYRIGRIVMLHSIDNVRSSLNERLLQSAARIRAAADQLEPGRKRNALIIKAREVDFAIEINTWLSASELRSPT